MRSRSKAPQDTTLQGPYGEGRYSVWPTQPLNVSRQWRHLTVGMFTTQNRKFIRYMDSTQDPFYHVEMYKPESWTLLLINLQNPSAIMLTFNFDPAEHFHAFPCFSNILLSLYFVLILRASTRLALDKHKGWSTHFPVSMMNGL